MKVDIMLVSKDRPAEIYGLLQSLRTQTHKDWNIWIVDDRSGLPYCQTSYIVSMMNRLKLEGHKVDYHFEQIRYGVTKLRRNTMDRILKEGDGEAILRLDDDNLLQPDYIERLIKVLESGYDIASGVVPVLGAPFIKRKSKFLKGIVNDTELDKEGKIIKFNDDCGLEFMDQEIIPAVLFRSMALIKREVHEKVNYEDNLGFCSFREENFFSFRAILEGFKIGVDTGAVAYHLATPSGGERTQEYNNGLRMNDEKLSLFCQETFKQKGDFLKEYKNGKL